MEFLETETGQALDDFYDTLSSTYQAAFAHDAGLLSYIQYILHLIPPSSIVLDVGCGTGILILCPTTRSSSPSTKIY